MSRTTLLVLAALVLFLGLAAWRELRKEAREEQSSEVLLFEGVDPARVRRLHVENLERDQHMVFERDERGRWRMVEPMSAPADSNLVGFLFQTALERRGTPVPEAEARASELGLDPPRIILEMEEDVPAATEGDHPSAREEDLRGSTKRTRVDLGAVDLDGAHLNVRARGLLLRTWRDLDTTLDRLLDDFLLHEVVDLSPNEVIEVHRRGARVRASGGEKSDLAFDALLEDEIWRATAPVEAPLDPQGMALYVQVVAALRVEGYADFGRRLLSDFGLDPPEFSLAFATVSNRTRTLRFGRPLEAGSGVWHMAIDGEPFVWTVEGRAVEFFSVPLEDLLDRALTRIQVGEVDGVSLVLDGRELRLWRDKAAERATPLWKVSERPAREAAFSPGVDADRRAVGDLLGAIARAEIGSFLLAEPLAEDEVRGSIVVQADDLQQGGRFGREVGSAEGGRAVRFQRTGDSIAGLVDPALVELLRTPLNEIRSRIAVELEEIQVAGLTLTGSGAKKRYARSSKGIWTPTEVEIEARELHGVLDSLLIVRAKRFLAPEDRGELAEGVEVEFQTTDGGSVAYTIGLAPDAEAGERARVERNGVRAVLEAQDLHRKVVELLAKQ